MSKITNMDFQTAAERFPQLKSQILTEPIIVNDKIIDPWDENLTIKEAMLLYLRCSCDVWYYLRYVVKLKTDDDVTEFTLNELSIPFIHLYNNDQSAIMIGDRHLSRKAALLRALYLHDKIFKDDGACPFIRGICLKIPEQDEIFMPAHFMDMATAIYRNMVISQIPRILTLKENYFLDNCREYLSTNPYRLKTSASYYCVDDSDLSIDSVVNQTYGTSIIVPFTDNLFDKDLKDLQKHVERVTGLKLIYAIGFNSNSDSDQ